MKGVIMKSNAIITFVNSYLFMIIDIADNNNEKN